MIKIGKIGLSALMTVLFGTVLLGTVWHETLPLQSQGEKEIIAKWAVGNVTDPDNTYEYIVSPYGIPVFSEESVTFIEYSDGTAHLFGIVNMTEVVEPLPPRTRQAFFRIDVTFTGRTTDLTPRGSECPADQQNIRYYTSAEGTLGFEVDRTVLLTGSPAQFGEGAFERLGCTNTGWFDANWGEYPIGVAFTLTPIHDAQIGNRVWEDIDRNGLQDAGELGIDGIEVRLHDGDRNRLATTTTANGGLYLFDNLTAGDYEVRFIKNASLIFTGRNIGDDDTKDSDANVNGWTGKISVAQSEQNYLVDAGLMDLPTPTPTDTATPTDTPTATPTPTHVPGSIGNRTWLDENRNGLQEPGEPNVSGIIVNLLPEEGDVPLATTTSDENGNYVFANLAPKILYRVQFVIPDGVELAFTTQNQGEDEEDSDAELTDGITADSITIDAGESDYSIDAGFYSTAPTATPTPTSTDTPTLTPAPTATHIPARIGDFVWLDVNGNGIQDTDEGGIGGIVVELLPREGDIPLVLTFTDGNGFYEFNGLNPKESYRVRFRLSTFSPLIFSPPNQGDDLLDSDADLATGLTGLIVLDANEENTSIDAGIYEPQPTATPTPTPTHVPGAAGNRTWLDENRNGLQDPGELNVSGIIVNLLAEDSDTPLATTTSDENGIYLFTTLDPKRNYRVQFVIPDGAELVFTTQNQGTDQVDSDPELSTGIVYDLISVDSSESDYSIDAGFYSTAPTATPTPTPTLTPIPTATHVPAQIGNFVWLDDNGDGIQDADETGIEGIIVELLLAEENTPLALTVTDGNGFYEFSGLNPKVGYRIRFRLSAFSPLSFSPPDQGDDQADSDVDPATGLTEIIVLAAGEENMSMDAGLYQPAPTATPTPTLTPTLTSTATVEPTATPDVEPTIAPTPVVDPENSIIMASTNTAAEGEEVVVILEGYNLAMLGTATIEVIYDPTVLTLVNCNKDPNNSFDVVQCNQNFGPDRMRFNITSLTGVSGDVIVAELTFEATGQNGDQSDITVLLPTLADADANALTINAIDGQVIISTVRVGDVSCDGIRNAVDSLFTLQYDVGLREASNSCTQPDPSKAILLITDCDINEDGLCNAIDALLSLQCDVGIANVSCPAIRR